MGSFQWNPNCSFPGHVIGVKEIVADATLIKNAITACGEACFRNPKCNYFTLNQKLSMCWLKTSSKSITNIAKTNSPGGICGFIENRVAFTPGRKWQTSTDGSHQWARGCDFRGNDLIKLLASYTTCMETCRANPSCAYFTFNKLRSICYLKKAVGFFTESKNVYGTICGFFPGPKSNNNQELIIDYDSRKLQVM